MPPQQNVENRSFDNVLGGLRGITRHHACEVGSMLDASHFPMSGVGCFDDLERGVDSTLFDFITSMASSTSESTVSSSVCYLFFVS